jgi:hypothetical protein
MRIEFFPEGNHDCPAILFYGCPSAGAMALINISGYLPRVSRPRVHYTTLST